MADIIGTMTGDVTASGIGYVNLTTSCTWPASAVSNGTLTTAANGMNTVTLDTRTFGSVSRKKIRTIIDVLNAEEQVEITKSFSWLLSDDENIAPMVKWLVYERLRQRHNAGLLERQIDALRSAMSYAPKEIAERAEAECAELQKLFIFDAYTPKEEDK